MQHHSHAKCDDCGTRHTPGNSTECIEVLKELHSDAVQIKDGLRENKLYLENDLALKMQQIAHLKVVLNIAGEDPCWTELHVEQHYQIAALEKKVDEFDKEICRWASKAKVAEKQIAALKAERDGYLNGQLQMQDTCSRLQDSIAKYAEEREASKADVKRLRELIDELEFDICNKY